MIHRHFLVQDQLFVPGPAFLLAPEDPYRLFARTILPQIQKTRPLLQQVYCANNGRPAVEPVLLAALCLLQFWERVPDRAAVARLNYHCGWAFAVGWEMGQTLFDPSVLSRFRQRLLQGQQERLLFDQLVKGLREVGLLKGQSSRRLDSTFVAGLVSQMSRLECVRETLRLALQELAPARPAEERPSGWTLWWERYVESKLDYRAEPAVFQAKLRQAGEDIAAVLAWAGQADGPQVALLRRVFGEQFEAPPPAAPAPGPQPKEKTPAGAVKNPHDPQAQWAKKGSGTAKKEVVGYKVQVAETAQEAPRAKGQPTCQFLTAIETQLATASDEHGMALVEAAEARLDLPAAPVRYVDAAYVSGAQLALAQAQGRELIGPAPAPPSREGRYSAAAFAISFDPLQARCPAGHLHASYIQWDDHQKGGQATRFDWLDQCRDCPLRAQCVGADQPSRTLAIGPHHELLQARRRAQATPEFRARCHHRNALEGTQSELVRAHGLRQARYRGLAKVRLQNYFIGAACNAKRWIRQLQWQSRQTHASAAQAQEKK